MIAATIKDLAGRWAMAMANKYVDETRRGQYGGFITRHGVALKKAEREAHAAFIAAVDAALPAGQPVNLADAQDALHGPLGHEGGAQ